MKKRRIILNNDFYNIFQIEPPVEDQDIHDAVDKVAGTQVDTLCLLLPDTVYRDAQKVLSPEITRLYEHPETDPCMRSLDALHAEGKDPFGMVLDRARQKGIEFLASVRMNDTHYLDQVFNPWIPQFYYDNLHNRVGPVQGRAGTEFDYRKSVVRARMLDMIRSAFERYDLDGLEMDMTRNCKFFPPDHPEECAPVMTEFVRQVRGILDEFGAERRKKLCLCAAIPHSLYGARREGLDVPLWARLGLIDIVCMSTPFLAEFGRDVRDARLKLPGVQVYAGCDRNFSFSFDGASRVVPSHTYRAMAMDYLRQGADGIYLYNVMSWTMNYAKATEAVKRDGGQGQTEQAPIDYDRNLMNEVGSIETLRCLDKLYVMSHGEEGAPDRPLGSVPVTVPPGGEVTLRMSIGDDVAQAAQEGRIEGIRLQTVSSDCADYGNYTVKLNAVDLSRQYAFVPYAERPQDVLLFPEPGRRGPLPEAAKVRRHPVRPIDLHMGVNFIAIKSYRDALTVTDVELAIMYGGQ